MTSTAQTNLAESSVIMVARLENVMVAAIACIQLEIWKHWNAIKVGFKVVPIFGVINKIRLLFKTR